MMIKLRAQFSYMFMFVACIIYLPVILKVRQHALSSSSRITYYTLKHKHIFKIDGLLFSFNVQTDDKLCKILKNYVYSRRRVLALREAHMCMAEVFTASNVQESWQKYQ